MKLTEHDIEKQLITIVQQFLTESGIQASSRTITLDISLQKHLGLDSLGRAELFQRIEKHFNVLLPDRLIADAETLQDLEKAIYTAKPTQKKQPHQTGYKTTHSSVDHSSTKTLLDILTLYAKADPDRPHIYLTNDDGKEELITYGKLYTSALRLASGLIKRGLQPGDTVAIMQPTCAGFYYTFYGILFAGCVPVPIYPPLRPHLIESYAKQEAHILNNAEVRMMVTFHEAEGISKLLSPHIPSLKYVVTPETLMQNQEPATPFAAKEDDFALIQYTSGSTSAPKGVLLTHYNLVSNIRAYGKAIAISDKDAAVSWLPLYHDLGLIGMWLGSLFYGSPLTAMSPLTFLNRPEQWLWAIHYHRATISGGPNFAYELCVRKIDPATIEGLDLSSWRIAANGAEAIQPKTLRRFAEKFAPYGFKLETFLPVYGLAESTVGLAVCPPQRKPWIDLIDRKSYEEEQRAVPTADANGLEFVSCGPALVGHEMRIVDDNNQLLPARSIGHLQFKGPSNMQGYYGNPEATNAILHDGWLDSGDFAYLVDGELFVTGRCKDIIIKAGRNLYPPEIEDLTAQVPGVRKGCVIAFGVSDTERGTEKLVIAAETQEKRPKERAEISAQIIDKVMDALDVAPDEIVLVAPRTIPKTSSGKLQRSTCKKWYLEGSLTKNRTPTWVQISKLGLGWLNYKAKKFLANVGKFIYTSYAVMLALFIIPIMWLSALLLPRNTAAKICKACARTMLFLGFIPLKVNGNPLPLANQAMIYAPNHSSYIDPFVLMAILPADTRYIGKQELQNAPIFKTFINKLGYLTVDRMQASRGIEDTKDIETLLKQGHSIVIFPEGTFSYAAGLRPFKSGTFKIAIDTNTPIIPVGLKGTRTILRGEEKLTRPAVVHITFCPPLYPDGKDWEALTRLKLATRQEIAKYCGEPTLDLIAAGPAASTNSTR